MYLGKEIEEYERTARHRSEIWQFLSKSQIIAQNVGTILKTATNLRRVRDIPL